MPGTRCMEFTLPPYAAFLFALLSSLGCATMLEGPKQVIRLHCNPSKDISVLVDGEPREFTIGEITLDKKRDAHFVTLRKEGYQPTTISFNREINPFWPFADLIWGPAFPIAWFVDWRTSALFRIDPRDVHVVLRKKEHEPDEKQ